MKYGISVVPADFIPNLLTLIRALIQGEEYQTMAIDCSLNGLGRQGFNRAETDGKSCNVLLMTGWH